MVHLATEPVTVSDVALQAFGKSFDNTLSLAPVYYDMHTNYAEIFGVTGHYQYKARESILAIRAYAQSEPCSI